MAKQRTPPAAKFVPLHRYHSPNIPMAAIRRYARRIAERFQPEKIILFGSYAYGTLHEDSDVDILVVMPAYNHISKAVRICQTLEPPFSLDLIVRAPDKLERRLKDGNWFLREIMEKGKVLYEKGNGKMGAQGRSRLRGARELAKANGPLNDLICFHCQ